MSLYVKVLESMFVNPLMTEKPHQAVCEHLGPTRFLSLLEKLLWDHPDEVMEAPYANNNITSTSNHHKLILVILVLIILFRMIAIFYHNKDLDQPREVDSDCSDLKGRIGDLHRGQGVVGYVGAI